MPTSLRDQDRRRLVSAALRVGTYTPWDYTPPADASQQYMRNHLDLNDVERGARVPAYDPSRTEARETPYD